MKNKINNKYEKLGLGILFDALGYLSFFFLLLT
jgi:hypothetical protein